MGNYVLKVEIKYAGDTIVLKDEYMASSVLDALNGAIVFLTKECSLLDDKYNMWFHFDAKSSDYGKNIEVLVSDSCKNVEETQILIGVGTLRENK